MRSKRRNALSGRVYMSDSADCSSSERLSGKGDRKAQAVRHRHSKKTSPVFPDLIKKDDSILISIAKNAKISVFHNGQKQPSIFNGFSQLMFLYSSDAGERICFETAKMRFPKKSSFRTACSASASSRQATAPSKAVRKPQRLNAWQANARVTARERRKGRRRKNLSKRNIICCQSNCLNLIFYNTLARTVSFTGYSDWL